MISARARLLLLLTPVFLRAQIRSPDPQKIFDLVRQRVAAIALATPNYTCVETVERSKLASSFQARGGCEAKAFALLAGTYKTVEQDRLRLDVGVAGNNEIFSWHGQHTFVTSDITKLVNGGAISSGSFFGFIADIFVGAHGRYFYHGLAHVDGRILAIFSYTMPRSASHFVTRTAAGRQVMAFHGRFTADPASGDLYSLSVDTDDLPADLHACSIDQTVTYQNITLNKKTFRIPLKVELSSNLQDHDQFKSITRYAGCHEFVGDSVIHYNPNPKLSLMGAVSTASLPALPAKLQLKVHLTSPVDSDSAWTGDPVGAVLENTLRGKHGRLLASKGSTLSGRIVRLEKFGGDDPYWMMGIRFERLETPDVEYKVTLDSKSPLDVASRQHRLARPLRFKVDEFEHAPGPGVGQFRVAGNHLHLDERFTSEWESVKATSK